MIADFTIDMIFPEIYNNFNTLEELKSPNGALLQIDTTQILKNFLIGEWLAEKH